jgi:hypothetical protein
MNPLPTTPTVQTVELPVGSLPVADDANDLNESEAEAISLFFTAQATMRSSLGGLLWKKDCHSDPHFPIARTQWKVVCGSRVPMRSNGRGSKSGRRGTPSKTKPSPNTIGTTTMPKEGKLQTKGQDKDESRKHKRPSSATSHDKKKRKAKKHAEDATTDATKQDSDLDAATKSRLRSQNLETTLASLGRRTRYRASARMHMVGSHAEWYTAVAHGIYAAATGVCLGAGSTHSPQSVLIAQSRASAVVSVGLSEVVRRRTPPAAAADLVRRWARWHGQALIEVLTQSRVLTPLSKVLSPSLVDEAGTLLHESCDDSHSRVTRSGQEGALPPPPPPSITLRRLAEWTGRVQEECGCDPIRVRACGTRSLDIGSIETSKFPTSLERHGLVADVCPEVATAWPGQGDPDRDDGAAGDDDQQSSSARIPLPTASIVGIVKDTNGVAVIVRAVRADDKDDKDEEDMRTKGRHARGGIKSQSVQLNVLNGIAATVL